MEEDFDQENFLNYDRFLEIETEKKEEQAEEQETCDLEDGCLSCGS